MKLFELFPNPEDLLDPIRQAGEQDRDEVAVDVANKEKRPARKSPKKSSNIEKAKRIRNLVYAHKRDVQPEKFTDTPHQYNMGGHHSSWLRR